MKHFAGVYGLWERCHHSTTRNISNAEETLEKFKQFEHELLTLKKGLRKDALRYRGRRSALRLGVGAGEGSCDSGISDASSTDNDFPLVREQQLERLRHLATNLEASLYPINSGMSSVISKTIESTSSQLKDLKLSFQRLKTSKVKKLRRSAADATSKRVLGGVQSAAAGVGAPSSAAVSRRRRVCRAAMLLNFLLMALMVLAALIHPRCCDAPGNCAHILNFPYGPLIPLFC